MVPAYTLLAGIKVNADETSLLSALCMSQATLPHTALGSALPTVLEGYTLVLMLEARK